MRRIIVIGALFLLMYALPYLQVEVESAFNPKSLATLGFILIAAYTLGELANTVGLPKITGYIVTGVVFGPYVINLFSLGVVEDLTLINSLAIGLIALTAGGEMRLEGLRRVARGLGWILAVKGLLILAVTIATVFLARPLIPFLQGAGTPLVLAVGMIFGVLALGTSPAVTVAVINETESRGRLADLTLGVAVAKDVVMVVLLAVAIALARLYSTPNAVFEPAVLGRISGELGLSVLAGSLVGLLAILYIRFVHAEMWLFVIGLILMTTAASDLLHLEVLLVLITAGFVVQNFSPYGDELVHPIERVSLPVYVVFFSIAGAGLDLGALRQVWAIAVILVLVRLAAIYLGTRVAMNLAAESVPMRRDAWLGFVAQAGVVLGLSLIVQENLTLSAAAGTGPLGDEIRVVVLATIALNLALGPVTFKIALSRVGETLRARQRAEAAGAVTAERAGEDAGLEPDSAAESGLPAPEFRSGELNAALGRLRDDLLVLIKDFQESFLDARTAELRGLLGRIKDQYRSSIEQFEQETGRTGQQGSDEL
ncbi:MAG: cation:proton antiporter, partial [Acidobacteriota bacterium]